MGDKTFLTPSHTVKIFVVEIVSQLLDMQSTKCLWFQCRNLEPAKPQLADDMFSQTENRFVHIANLFVERHNILVLRKSNWRTLHILH